MNFPQSELWRIDKYHLGSKVKIQFNLKDGGGILTLTFIKFRNSWSLEILPSFSAAHLCKVIDGEIYRSL